MGHRTSLPLAPSMATVRTASVSIGDGDPSWGRGRLSCRCGTSFNPRLSDHRNGDSRFPLGQQTVATTSPPTRSSRHRRSLRTPSTRRDDGDTQALQRTRKIVRTASIDPATALRDAIDRADQDAPHGVPYFRSIRIRPCRPSSTQFETVDVALVDLRTLGDADGSACC